MPIEGKGKASLRKFDLRVQNKGIRDYWLRQGAKLNHRKGQHLFNSLKWAEFSSEI